LVVIVQSGHRSPVHHRLTASPVRLVAEF
jgi:hypothetical protein